MAEVTNKDKQTGALAEIMKGKDVFIGVSGLPDTECEQQLADRNTCGTSSIDHNICLIKWLSNQLQCIDQSCRYNNRCTMLIIMEYWNI